LSLLRWTSRSSSRKALTHPWVAWGGGFLGLQGCQVALRVKEVETPLCLCVFGKAVVRQHPSPPPCLSFGLVIFFLCFPHLRCGFVCFCDPFRRIVSQGLLYKFLFSQRAGFLVDATLLGDVRRPPLVVRSSHSSLSFSPL